MAENGVQSNNLTTGPKLDEIIGNAGGSTRRMPVEKFASQLIATRPISLLGMQAPLFALFDDLEESSTTATSAWVYGDGAASGIYGKVNGVWTWALPLPYSFIEAQNAGAGTANAIVATSDLPITDGPLVILPIVATTTGPATVSFNGAAPLTIKTASGASLPPNALTGGMRVMGIRSQTEFRLVTDIRDGALAAQAQLAADQAVAAAISANEAAEFFDPDRFVTYDDMSTAVGANIYAGSAMIAADIADSDEIPVRDVSAAAPKKMTVSALIGAIFKTARKLSNASFLSSFRLWDATDQTKGVAFNLAGIASGQVRTITVPDQDIVLGSGGGGRKLLEVKEISTAVASLDFTLFDSSKYMGYEVYLSEVTLSALTYILGYTSGNGGTSWDNAANSYDTTGMLRVTATWNGSGGLGTSMFVTAQGADQPSATAGYTAISGKLEIITPEKLQPTKIKIDLEYFRSNDNRLSEFDAAAARLSNTAVNGLRLAPASGNFTSGTVYFFGIPKT